MAFCSCLLVVTIGACSDVQRPQAVQIKPARKATDGLVHNDSVRFADSGVHRPNRLEVRARREAAVTLAMAEVLIAEARAQEIAGTVTAPVRARTEGALVPLAAVPAPFVNIGSATSLAIADVMLCIRQHESGDYAESRHPNGSSGAYQYQPATWRAWSERAGYPGYARAYLAPASVQDAVTAYTLTHGGAGNWSPRYGDDPCTVGMGG